MNRYRVIFKQRIQGEPTNEEIEAKFVQLTGETLIFHGGEGVGPFRGVALSVIAEWNLIPPTEG